MLLYIKRDKDLYNLDNLVTIYPKSSNVFGRDISGNIFIIFSCDDDETPIKIVYDIYKKMTYGNENMILDLENYRDKETETAQTRKALRNNKCNTCIYVDTDGCKEWDNDGTGCDAHITEEEAMKDGNEEK